MPKLSSVLATNSLPSVCRFTLVLALALLPFYSLAQQELLRDQWLQLETENFHIFSQASSRQTARIAGNLEAWRQLAAFTIDRQESFPKAAVPNYVYIFDGVASLVASTGASGPGFFSSTPRANFMAFLAGDEDSMKLAFHHYVHFLVRNFSDLRLPRWYEEGLASYVSRMRVDRQGVDFERFSATNMELAKQLSETLSMDRLFYRDDALASPRMIQIANMKSDYFLHYVLHAYEEKGFNDRREQLQEYLGLILQGRNPRFAYDRAFDVTIEQLDEEFHDYLINSKRPRGTIQTGTLSVASDYEAVSIEGGRLALALAELALNSGNFEAAQLLFQTAIDLDRRIARGHSGVGDAMRLQELQGQDQDIARHFEQAVSLAPNDPNILLDYGAYWEEELLDCDKTWPAGQRQLIISDMTNAFQRALELAAEAPEANLAMGRLFLVDEDNWLQGKDYQRKAYSLLPADSFIMEQEVRYAIFETSFEEAEVLINELAQPMHFWGEPDWVSDLRERLLRKRRGEPYDLCAED